MNINMIINLKIKILIIFSKLKKIIISYKKI